MHSSGQKDEEVQASLPGLPRAVQTEIGAGTAWALVVGFLAAVLIVPIGEAFFSLEEGSDTSTVPGAESDRGLFDLVPRPRQIQAFEDRLEEASFLHRRLRPGAQSFLTRWTGLGNESVLVGREDWLFYRKDVEHVTGPGFLDPEYQARRRLEGDEWNRPPHPDPIEAIQGLHRELSSRGIDLVLVPVPSKVTLHPEKLSRSFDSSRVSPRNLSFPGFLDRMSRLGVAVVDPTPLLREWSRKTSQPSFLSRDTHWTPGAMEQVAQAVASRVVHLTSPGQASSDFLEVTAVAQRHVGDTAALLELPTHRQAELSEDVTLSRVTNPNGEPWRPDRRSKVLLLGDSFSNIYSMEGLGWGTSAGFAEQISRFLGESIDRIAVNDGGAFSSRSRLSRQLRQGRDRLAGKKVVVFQFAARELSFGDWKPIDFVLGQNEDPPRSPEEIAVDGVIAKVAPRPDRDGPYADAITSFLLKRRPADREDGGREMLIFSWGLRDRRLTAAAGFRVGQRVRLRVKPWSRVENALEGYRRMELDDPQAASLTPWWAEMDSGWDGQDINSEVARMRESGRMVLEGRQGWLFFRPELESLGKGDSWIEDYRPLAARDAGPVRSIVDFDRQLERLGIDLIVMPVPYKASIYPGFLPGGSSPLPSALPRLLEALKRQGVEVLDLEPAFQDPRHRDRDLYCRQDTHWSPAGAELAARLIGRRVSSQEWFAAIDKGEFHRNPASREIEGDLWKMLKEPGRSKETIEFLTVMRGDVRSRRRVRPDRQSPVLLMGDSHTLVFHSGRDLHAVGAGLPDQLAYWLGFPVDLIGVRGAGSSAARLSLLRRKDNLRGKRLVIWVFAARELTESRSGWPLIPVVRPGN